jgi:hypothetical protein
LVSVFASVYLGTLAMRSKPGAKAPQYQSGPKLEKIQGNHWEDE